MSAKKFIELMPEELSAAEAHDPAVIVDVNSTCHSIKLTRLINRNVFKYVDHT